MKNETKRKYTKRGNNAGRKEGSYSPKTSKKVEALLAHFREAIKNNEWDKYWTKNDITSIAYEGDTYVTFDKKQKASNALQIVQRLLRRIDGVALYSVSRSKGYRLFPSFSELPESMKEQATADALVVFHQWMTYTRTILGPSGPLQTMKERGKLKLSSEDRKLLGETTEEILQLTTGNK